MESIQAACPTNFHKNEKVIDFLPKCGPHAFTHFCRALSASGQNHIRDKIQPEGMTWCIGLSVVLNCVSTERYQIYLPHQR